ncbi:MAG TPA: FtsX-like permease family protein [Cyclobacteriaceae bacterium]|nr:FtsX-like permease family protein [Cyclobacteriaceae bacterium]
MIEYIIRLKRKTLPIWRDRWVWRMAWRDARHNLSRLFLLVASLITGIAAVVSIGSLNYSLQKTLDQNAKELLGADLVINSNKRLDKSVTGMLDSADVQTASDAEMASMIMFMNTRQSRLVKLTALKGEFPFYGKLETQPLNAYELMKTGRYAMLDESLARQFEISSEDSVKLGNTTFKVAGIVNKIPGGGALTSTLAPSVYISMNELDSTGLVQFGSRVSYRTFIKTNGVSETDKTVEKIKPLAKKERFSYETVERRKEGLGKSFGSVYQFFSLLAFVALILGCIGVASSVHIYAREKREEVAVLRCVGSTGWQAFNIYFIQVFFLGLLGSLVGAALGAAIQKVIPLVFKNFIPVDMPFAISWEAVAEGLVVGAVVSVLFAILPLVAIRFVPPLSVLRADAGPVRVFSRMRWTAILLIILFPILAAGYQTNSIISGLAFTAGLAAALAFLALVAWLLLKLIRRFFPKRANFSFRHALSNLYRPNNQTQVLMVTIGLGGFIIATLNIVQHSLLGQVEFTGNRNQSNTILFDIQPSQKDGVVKLINDHHLPLNQIVPIITCRLKELKGRSVEKLMADTTSRIPDWSLTREYRVTYRDSLHGSEELIKGAIHSLKHGQRDSVWISISEGMQETLHIDVGDSLLFDIQGVEVQARISGIRKVEWPKDPPNFIFVFPKGVIDQAPQIWVATTHVSAPNEANRFQQELVMDFPNVSLVDLRLILSTVEDLFNKISLVIRFLALFSIVTGLVVLAGAVVNSKFARIKENVLLRTIGARSRQIMQITLIEYAYLGLFSALTGIILSLAGGWALCRFFFEVQIGVAWLDLLFVGIAVMILTVFIGWINSREVISTPPLQVLRKE